MRNGYKILLVSGFSLLLFFIPNLCRTETLEDKSQNAVKALYHFRFQEADSLIAQLEKHYPAHYLPYVVRSQYYWWKLISQPVNDKTKLRYRESLLHAEERIIQNLSEDNPDDHDLFHLINIYASKARLDLMNLDYWKALQHLHKSAGYIRQSLTLEEVFSPFLLTSGLYNYMAGHGEEVYAFFRIYTLRYPRGNKERGLQQLKKAATGNDILVKTEANYFLMKIYTEIEEEYLEALPYAKWLSDTYPDNLIYLHHYFEVMQHLNRKNLSEQIKSNFFQSLERNHQLDNRQIIHLRELF